MLESLLLLFYPFSEIGRFWISSEIAIRIIDGLVFIYLLAKLGQLKNLFVKSKLQLAKLLFPVVLLFSFLINWSAASLPAGLYLIRTLMYLCLALICRFEAKLNRLFSWILIFILITGLIQYFLYPNLRNLLYLGYDPHTGRLFGLFLDPNVLGLVCVWSCFWFSTKQSSLPQQVNWLSAVLALVCLILTFSRISYLVFLISVFFYFSQGIRMDCISNEYYLY
jgi:hypothetical protein